MRGAEVEPAAPSSEVAELDAHRLTLPSASDRDFFPPTAWTKIVQAQNPASVAHRPSLAALAALYDRPLLRLFRQKLYDPWRCECEDWKQDFILTHLLSGKIILQVRPASRFRSYLAAAVRNYIRDRLASVQARREVPLEIEPEVLDEDEALLSRERALDCVELATRQLMEWAVQLGDPQRIGFVQSLAGGAAELRRIPRLGTVHRDVIERFKQLLRQAVREEMLVDQNQDEQSVLDREATILIQALARPRGSRT